MMKYYEDVQLVIDAKAVLAEGPAWNPAANTLHWVDIKKCEVHSYNVLTGIDTALELGQNVGAVVPEQKGRLVAALTTGFYLIDGAGIVSCIAKPEGLSPRLRFNDGKCDRRGRFWAGTTNLFRDEPGNGILYCLEPGGQVRSILSRIGVSNGLAWNKDDTVMYYIDTPTLQVVAYDFDLESGTLGSGKVAIQIPTEYGYPDGMTIDEEGMLWVAHWGGSSVGRYDPASGKCIGLIRIPASQVTSCCFCGDHLETLYITTASETIDKRKEPYAGGIFRIDPGVLGTPTFSYRMDA